MLSERENATDDGLVGLGGAGDKGAVQLLPHGPLLDELRARGAEGIGRLRGPYFNAARWMGTRRPPRSLLQENVM